MSLSPLLKWQNSDYPSSVDVLIVGAGPGGLACAATLLDSHASVLMVDARRTIGSPLRCGELTRPKLFDLYGVERAECIRWELSDQQAAIVIDRPRVERDMAEYLAWRGVDVRRATAVMGVDPFDGVGRTVSLANEKDERFSVRARLIIAADGVASRVAHWCGIDTFVLPSMLASCLAYRITGAKLVNPYSAYFFYFPRFPPFYYWVIPSGPNEAQIGQSLAATQGILLQRTLDETLNRTKQIEGGQIVDRYAGMYTICPPLAEASADGLLVVGGAARLVKPRTGEGIYPAALSGRLAAKTFLGLGSRDATAENLASYDDALDEVRLEVDEWV